MDTVHPIFKVFFLDDSTGWFASGNEVYASTNGGESWLVRGTTNPYIELETIFFITKDSGWAGGYLGFVQTTDGGKTWQTTNTSPGNVFVQEIYFIDHLQGYVTGYLGNYSFIVRTTDGGKVWTEQANPLPSGAWPQSVYFIDKKHGWVVGYGFGNAILYTSNGGEQWNLVDTPAQSDFLRVKFSGSNGGWILGSYGKILHTDASPLLAVDQGEQLLIPTQFTLMQNYPNPFNPQTVIRYQLPVNGWVSLKVYNILGQEVRTLVEELQEAGYKSVEWNGMDSRGVAVPSGLYFVRMTSGKFSDVKKAMLLK